MVRFISVLILVLAVGSMAFAQQSLVGTYKLVSLQRELDGKADPLPGNPPRGYLIITPKAYVMLQTEGTRTYGESAAAKAALWESMVVTF